MLQPGLQLQAHQKSSDSSVKVKGIPGIYPLAGPMQAAKLLRCTSSLRLGARQLTQRRVQEVTHPLGSTAHQKADGIHSMSSAWSLMPEPGERNPPVPSQGLGCLWALLGRGWTITRCCPGCCPCPQPPSCLHPVLVPMEVSSSKSSEEKKVITSE